MPASVKKKKKEVSVTRDEWHHYRNRCVKGTSIYNLMNALANGETDVLGHLKAVVKDCADKENMLKAMTAMSRIADGEFNTCRVTIDDVEVLHV